MFKKFAFASLIAKRLAFSFVKKKENGEKNGESIFMDSQSPLNNTLDTHHQAQGDAPIVST